MSDFQEDFLGHSEEPWRSRLGCEPALMPPECLEAYRGIQRSGYDTGAFRPWAARITEKNRMLLHCPCTTPPPMPELEWRRATADPWLGRRPASGAAS